MEKQDEELIRSLVDKDPELRRHYEEHLEFERQLKKLARKARLSVAEEVERKRLQKLKLAGKDQLMGLLNRRRQDGGAPGQP